MSKTPIKILKQCLNCGQMFEDQNVTTKYCSHTCNCQHYKLKARLANIEETQTRVSFDVIKQKIRPVLKSIDMELIKEKKYLKVREVAEYKSWLVNAGITKHITFHCFQHTFATLQLASGTDIYTVSKILGHRELKTTQIYAKVIDESKRKAADRIRLEM